MMSQHSIGRCRCLALLVFVGVLAGCALTEPSRFYLLSTTPPKGVAAPAADSVAVGVEPVSLPAYLDRPQIVRRESAHTLELSEFHRWGEPLDGAITRVLAGNLAARLKSERVFVVSARPQATATVTVDVDFARFDADPDGSAVMSAQWRVLNARGAEVAASRTEVRQPAGATVDDTVAALSNALGVLSDDIAATIRRR
jgi:hypothetical protein